MSISTENATEVLVSEITDEDMQELVGMYIDELPNRIEQIERAIDAIDLETLATLSHQMKGAAGGYGFPTIGEAARLLELSAKAGDRAELLSQHADVLIDLCRRACAAVPV